MDLNRDRSLLSKLFHLVGYFTIATAIMLVVFAGMRMGEDHTAWFNYESVESTKEVWPLGANPTIVSMNEINRVPALLKYTDVLRCDLDNDGTGELFYSVYPSEFKQTATRGMQEGEWVYNALTPTVPATCYIDSTTCADTFFGPKCQNILSEEFRFE